MMISQLYKLVDKGSWRALSLILAIVLSGSIFFNSYLFIASKAGAPFLLTLWLIWGMMNLWIHGMGLNIRKPIWQLIFSPWIGYICAIFGVYYIYFYR